MDIKNTIQKRQIYFSRAYRHLEPNKKEQWLFLLLFVLPSLILFLIFYTKVSYALSIWVKHALSACIPNSCLGIAYSNFLPVFGGIYYVQTQNLLPSDQEVIINLALTIVLLAVGLFSSRNKKGGTPLSIYFAIVLLLHLIACIYFTFAKEFFPYSATKYSELYMLQQVGIWMSFLVLAGLVTGIVGYGRIAGKLLTFLAIIIYSFIFGCVRYLTFLFIVSAASSLYMTTLFFSLGPLYDFLYLVCIYSIFINVQIKHFDQGEGRLKWHWM